MSSMRILLGCNKGSNPIGYQRASLTPYTSHFSASQTYEALCNGPAGGCHDLITPPPEVPSTGQGQLTQGSWQQWQGTSAYLLVF